MNSYKPKVVVIGGGTGTYVVLSGLKAANLDLTAIVTMMDSGGSTGRLRDQLGVLPPGDLRQALVALSSSDKIWRDLFTYRFDAGDLDGHNFGNIFISALEKITGSIQTGLDLAEKILGTNGKVVPITFDKCDLCAKLKNGEIIKREALIDESPKGRSKIVDCFLSPRALPNPDAISAIEKADYIIFGPGDLFTSIIPNLAVSGVAATVRNSKAKKVYICNLMTKLGQTDGFTASDHLKTLEEYLEAPIIDYLLVNKKKPNKEMVTWYSRTGDSIVVENDTKALQKKRPKLTVVCKNLISDTKYESSLADRLKRSLIRHDQDKLGEALIDICFYR